MQPFTPSYLTESELSIYDLPTPDAMGTIMNLVQTASTMIDEACGRIDGDGNGSLVYTTYTNRILLQARNRNLIQVPMKPISAVDAATVTLLMDSASGAVNFTYTGVLANTINGYAGSLSGIIGASGRYGYVRQDMAVGYPDLWATINPLNLVTMFGGPAPFVQIDITNLDYDSKTGEAWIPAGFQLQKYSEVVIVYNSGYNPLRMPRIIKNVCASATKNLLTKGAGTTGMTSINLGKSGANIQMGPTIIDANLDAMLVPFKNVRAY